MSAKFPKMPTAMVVYSWDRPEFKNFNPQNFSIEPETFKSVFGIPCMVESDGEDETPKIFCMNARPVAITHYFKNSDLSTLPVFILRRKVDENGVKLDSEYEPYGPCKIVSIEGAHNANFVNITISGPRGTEDEIHLTRIFAIAPIENNEEGEDSDVATE